LKPFSSLQTKEKTSIHSKNITVNRHLHYCFLRHLRSCSKIKEYGHRTKRKQRKVEEGTEERKQGWPARASPSSPSPPADQVRVSSSRIISFKYHLHCASEF
jgi:hypothetical protein